MNQSDHTCFYELLQVSPSVSTAELRSAFLRLAQQYHPDLNRDNQQADRDFKRIRRAYEVLSDPILRAAYDDNPHRFSLDRSLATDDEPIRSSPRKRQPLRQPSFGRPFAYRTTWLADRRLLRERRFVITMLVAAAVVLAAIAVDWLSQVRYAMALKRRTETRVLATIPSTASPSTPPAPDTTADVEDVLRSVDEVRESDDATTSDDDQSLLRDPDTEPALANANDPSWRNRFDISDGMQKNTSQMFFPVPSPPPPDPLRPSPWDNAEDQSSGMTYYDLPDINKPLNSAIEIDIQKLPSTGWYPTSIRPEKTYLPAIPLSSDPLASSPFAALPRSTQPAAAASIENLISSLRYSTATQLPARNGNGLARAPFNRQLVTTPSAVPRSSRWNTTQRRFFPNVAPSGITSGSAPLQPYPSMGHGLPSRPSLPYSSGNTPSSTWRGSPFSR